VFWRRSDLNEQLHFKAFFRLLVSKCFFGEGLTCRVTHLIPKKKKENIVIKNKKKKLGDPSNHTQIIDIDTLDRIGTSSILQGIDVI